MIRRGQLQDAVTKLLPLETEVRVLSDEWGLPSARQRKGQADADLAKAKLQDMLGLLKTLTEATTMAEAILPKGR